MTEATAMLYIAGALMMGLGALGAAVRALAHARDPRDRGARLGLSVDDPDAQHG